MRIILFLLYITMLSACQVKVDYGEMTEGELRTLINQLNNLVEQKSQETLVRDSLNLIQFREDSVAKFNFALDSINNSILKDRALADLSPMGFIRLNTGGLANAAAIPYDDNKEIKLTKSDLGHNKDALSYNWYAYEENKDTLVVVTGEILGKADNYIKISMLKPYEEDYVRTIKVNSEQKFNRVITLKEAGFYNLNHKGHKYNVYISPGDTLDLTIDHSTDEGLEFYGKTADVNNYLRCRYLQDKAMAPNEWKLYNQKFEDFTEDANYYKTIKENNFNEFLKKDINIAKSFVDHEKADIAFDWGRKQLKYQKTNKDNPDGKYRSNGKYFKKLKFSDSKNFHIYNFRKFVYEYFDFFSKKKLVDKYGEDGQYNFPPDERAMMRYKDINYYFKSKTIREFLKTDLTYEKIKEFKNPSVNAIVLKARKDVKNEDYLALLDAQYKKYVPLRDGSFAPDFTITDSNGNQLTRDDLKGKFVYMAVWASWCAPCKIEQPHLERLKQEYAGNRKIKILSISIDEDRSKWDRALKFRDISKPQYIAPGNWNSSFARAFDVKSVPKYILIDPEGQIVDLSTSKPSADIRIKLDHLGV